MSGIYDVTLADGATALVPALGSFAKVVAAPQGTVILKLDGGEGYTLMAGQGIRLPDGQTFRDVSVRNTSGVSQTILVFIGDSRFEDSRISGTVSVINQITDKVLQLEASGAPMLATGFATLVIHTVANNRNGVRVRRVGINCTAGAGGTSEMRMVAAPANPAVMVPTVGYTMAGCGGAAGVPAFDSRNDMHYELPPAWGVWILTNHTVAAATVAGYAFTFERL